MRQKFCGARSCGKIISRSRVFCRDHWFMLPKPLRDAIWQAHRNRDHQASVNNIREAMRLIRDMEKGDELA